MLHSINHFRALAICLIVSAHSAPICGLAFDSVLSMTIINLMVGCTSLFVFISGFLFHHIFYPRYKYGPFFSKKVSLLAVPYTLLGIFPITVLVMFFKDQALFGGFFQPQGDGIVQQYVIPALKYYITGAFNVGYWYIPFVLLLFATSPLHVRFVHLSQRVQLSIIGIGILVACFIHRPLHSLNPFHFLVYLTPVYLLGIHASINKETLYKKLHGKEIYLFVLTLLFAFIQAYQRDYSNYYKNAFEFNGIDWMYLQKISMCYFLLIWLHRFENYQNPLLTTVANTSFAIYFLHPTLIQIKLNVPTFLEGSWLFLFFYSGLVISICILVALSLKKLFKKYSRYLIGY